MKNLELLLIFFFILIISGCSDQNSNKTKLKGDFVFENKTIKNDSSNDVKYKEVRDLSGEIRDESEKLEDKSKMLIDKSGKLKVKDEKEKSDKVKVKGAEIKVKNEKLKSKDPILIEDPVKIPKKWSNAYSNDPKWMELFQETSNSFLASWANEFQRNPEARISKEELLFAYRRRMEKIFYETPSFIEFSVNELKNSDQFRNLITDFQSNIQ
jgi:hypothetical protein